MTEESFCAVVSSGIFLIYCTAISYNGQLQIHSAGHSFPISLKQNVLQLPIFGRESTASYVEQSQVGCINIKHWCIIMCKCPPMCRLEEGCYMCRTTDGSIMHSLPIVICDSYLFTINWQFYTNHEIWLFLHPFLHIIPDWHFPKSCITLHQ